MITGTVSGADKLEARFMQAVPKINSAVQNTIMDLAINLVGHIKENKLSGQVLNRRTGRLSRSIHAEYDINPNKAVAIVGTNVEYAAIHEYGGVIERQMRIQKTYFKVDAEGFFKKGFSKKSKSNFMHETTVHAHGYKMPMRSFLRTALKDFEPRITSELEKAIKEELKAI